MWFVWWSLDLRGHGAGGEPPSALMGCPGYARREPRMVRVQDQRVSLRSITLNCLSVLMAPILKLVPFAVLFGVASTWCSGMNGVRQFDKAHNPCVMPVKHSSRCAW